MMEFTLAGKRFDLTPEGVIGKMQGIKPEVIRIHVVRINKTYYPCKQVMSVATDLPKADFNSHQAHQVLKRLGLPVKVIPKDQSP